MPFGYRLRKPWIDGRTEIVLEPIAFLRRLAALIPSPYTNLVRYHGVFANRSRDRFRIPLPPAVEASALTPPDKGATDPADGEDASGVEAPMPTVRPRRLGWAKLLRRVLNVDALTCPECTTSMTVIPKGHRFRTSGASSAQLNHIAFLTDPPVIKRILDHLSLPSSPPMVAPARSPLDEAGLFANEPPDNNGDDWTYQEEGSQIARAPP